MLRVAHNLKVHMISKAIRSGWHSVSPDLHENCIISLYFSTIIAILYNRLLYRLLTILETLISHPAKSFSILLLRYLVFVQVAYRLFVFLLNNAKSH